MSRVLSWCVSATMALFVGSLSAGCNQRSIASVALGDSEEVLHDFAISQNRELDILFVIDNSHSMEAEQQSLIEHFDDFMATLEGIEGGLPNVHIGVISTDVGVGEGHERFTCDALGDEGHLRPTYDPSCAADLPSERFIEDIDAGDGTRKRNYPAGKLSESFSCMARLGIAGCGYEQPLESMRRALDPQNLVNQGFVREGAYLAVVFITDEDDCSASDQTLFGPAEDALDQSLPRRSSFRCFQYGVQCAPDAPTQEGAKQDCVARADSPYMAPVTDYVDFLRQLKGRDELLIVAGITGDPGPVEVFRNDAGQLDLRKSCGEDPEDDDSGAVPATRLDAFLDSFDYSAHASLCGEDLSAALVDVGNLMAHVIDNRCLEGSLRDFDAVEPGIQPECQVLEMRDADGVATESVVARCDAVAEPESSSRLPCYVIEHSPDSCDFTDTGLEIRVYPEDRSLPPDTRLEVRCLAE